MPDSLKDHLRWDEEAPHNSYACSKHDGEKEAMKSTPRLSIANLIGVFLIGCALLVFELLLTRIFSVSLWYHFAFFAISIALFGLGASGICVQVFSKWFSDQILSYQLVSTCLAAGLTMISPSFFLLRVRLPSQFFLTLSGYTTAILSLMFILSSLPFFFGGLVISLLFKSFPDAIGKLYFADLSGASVGCLLTLFLLKWVGAPSAILVNAALAALAGLCFLRLESPHHSHKSLWVLAASVPCLLVAMVGYNVATSGFELKFAKGFDRSQDEFAKWNAISRVAVFSCETKAPAEWIARAIWGVSPNFHGSFPEMKCIDIDGQAGTFLTRFKGNWDSVAYVTQDPPSIVHRLRKNSETLIIGAGGGKDVLAALSLGAAHVTAVELNPIIVNDIMLKRYKELSGGIYEHPKVTAVAAEGRNYLRGNKKSYDIVQLAFVDTSAAISAGGYVLAENHLYTVEAFTEYLSHLKEGGIFSVSWVDVPGLLGGTRLTSLGLAALERLGVKEVQSHVITVTYAPQSDWVIQTILLKRSPFTDEEEARVIAVCHELGFQPTYLPHHPTQAPISKLILHANRTQFYRSLPVDISPTTDDRPFFFYQDRIGDWIRMFKTKELPGLTYGVGLQLLSRLALATVALVCVFFLGPMFLVPRRAEASSQNPNNFAFPYLFYFCCLGLGFMFLEIALLQKFLLFLGHPFYTLSTTLFSLLFFAGLGSLFTQHFSSRSPRTDILRVILPLMVTVLAYRWSLYSLFGYFIGFASMVKVILAIFLLMPLGFLMGMPFPRGIQAVHKARMERIIPWVWGLNGGTSVMGSVLAMIVAMNFGYNATLLTGLGFYAGAFLVAVFFPKPA